MVITIVFDYFQQRRRIQTRIFLQNSVLHQANEKGKGEREQVELEEMRTETKEMRRGTKEQWKSWRGKED